jgi:hypothetical protein
LDFPHVAQVIRLQRTVHHRKTGRCSQETTYYITSLPPDRAGPEDLGRLIRGHWIIESQHWIRDVIFDEDRSQIRRGHAPQVMARLRGLAIELLRLLGVPNVAQALRFLNRCPELVCAALGL